jgi:hypothetical protein
MIPAGSRAALNSSGISSRAGSFQGSKAYANTRIEALYRHYHDWSRRRAGKGYLALLGRGWLTCPGGQVLLISGGPARGVRSHRVSLIHIGVAHAPSVRFGLGLGGAKSAYRRSPRSGLPALLLVQHTVIALNGLIASCKMSTEHGQHVRRHDGVDSGARNLTRDNHWNENVR